jgi:hypothetical protein
MLVATLVPTTTTFANLAMIESIRILTTIMITNVVRLDESEIATVIRVWEFVLVAVACSRFELRERVASWEVGGVRSV